VDGGTVARLADAVRAGDLAQVRVMLDALPELVHTALAENDERRALHFAVLGRAPAMVRLLMERGADARTGIYPHRDATTALTIAAERGYGEIVAIISEEGARRAGVHTATSPSNATVTEAPDDLGEAVRRGDADFLRARHAEGSLENAIGPAGGLLTLAVKHDRPEILALLLDLGFDPNERTRLEGVEQIVYSAGFPLWRCAALGKDAMAEMLLTRGANPNVHVYASGSPVYSAYRHRRPEVVDLLKRYGGVVGADIVGLYRETELAKQMLADASGDGGRAGDGGQGGGGALPEGMVSPGRTVAEDLLDYGSCGGDPEIVRMALERIDWPRDDPQWFWMLGRSLESDSDGGSHLECFRQVLERSGPHMIGRFGRTTLHEVAAQRNPVTAEEAAAFATLLLDAGARTDIRDDLLKSTPLGWACRWGRVEIVQLLLERRADPLELDAESWATPRAWAEKMSHSAVIEMLRTMG